MADVKYGQNVDLQNYELRNAKIHPVNGLPAANAGNKGWVVYNTVDDRLYVSTGSAWTLKATDSDLLGGQSSAFHLARGNHSGTQTASTISDFTSAVQAVPVNTLAAPNGALGMNNQKITGLAVGTASSDAATKGQLDAVASQVDYKASVRLASLVNITPLSGATAVDGIAPAAGNRILLAGQTDPVQNGIWVAAAGAWTRATDADEVGEISGGTVVAVEEGTAHADTMWICTTNGAITPGTTANAWTKYGASSGEIITAGAGLTKTGTTVDVGQGNGIIVDADAVRIDPAVVMRRVAGALGNASASITINHGLGTKDVAVHLYENATGDEIIPGITRTDTNNVTFNLAEVPAAADTYRYVIIG